MLDEQLYAVAFNASPYRWPVVGWMGDLNRIDRRRDAGLLPHLLRAQQLHPDSHRRLRNPEGAGRDPQVLRPDSRADAAARPGGLRGRAERRAPRRGSLPGAERDRHGGLQGAEREEPGRLCAGCSVLDPLRRRIVPAPSGAGVREADRARPRRRSSAPGWPRPCSSSTSR